MKRILLMLLIIVSVFLCACHNDSNNTLMPVDYGDDSFIAFANSNPYDLEYQQLLRDDECPIDEAMANLMTNWNDELEYTISVAEPLIGKDYDSWKNNMLSNIEAINDIYRVQYDCAISEHIAQAQICEIKIRQVYAIRDLTLNAKYFCFILEKESGTAQEDMISLSWNVQ